MEVGITLTTDAQLPHPWLADGTVLPEGWARALGPRPCLELEVGCGRGEFLLQEAVRRPLCGFVGVEVARSWAAKAAASLARAGVSNAIVVRADAHDFLTRYVPSQCLDAIHVYFPDPWPRPRHGKRRLFREEFVAQCLRVLKPGGRIVVATDIRGYFVAMQGVAGRFPELVQSPLPEGWPLTPYARKFLRLGRPVFATTFRKEGGAPPGGPSPSGSAAEMSQ